MTLFKTAILLLILLVMALTALWLKPQVNFHHDQPRHLPWLLPDYKLAKTSVEVLADGRIKIEIEHLPLTNISPEMVAWFYQQLPISTIEFSSPLDIGKKSTNKVYPLYHIFHPTEHGVIRIKEMADNNVQGMAKGALISRQEWFGPFNSKGAGRIIALSAQGMTVKPEIAGVYFGLINHTFTKTNSGTQYHLSSIIGSDLPIIGPLINYYMRSKMFSPLMLKQWLRHQVEEVSSLQFFLAELYLNKDNVVQTIKATSINNHYKIMLTAGN